MRNRRKKGEIEGGGSRMVELGYKPIQLWVDRDDMELLKQAAKLDDWPMTRYILFWALKAAKEDIAKNSQKKAE